MYGFVTRFHTGSESAITPRMLSRLVPRRYVLKYTDGLERFKYWLAVNGRMPSKVELKNEGNDWEQAPDQTGKRKQPPTK